jgi:hypothetical protein
MSAEVMQPSFVPAGGVRIGRQPAAKPTSVGG